VTKPDQIKKKFYYKKTLALFLKKTAPGFNIQKDMITVMLCTNGTDNHRLSLVVIGKSKKLQH